MKTPEQIISDLLGKREELIDLEGFEREKKEALREIEAFYAAERKKMGSIWYNKGLEAGRHIAKRGR